jgi:hypothetical protein
VTLFCYRYNSSNQLGNYHWYSGQNVGCVGPDLWLFSDVCLLNGCNFFQEPLRHCWMVSLACCR